MHAIRGTHSVSLSLVDPNRPDALGAAISAVLPLAAVITANAVAASAGLQLDYAAGRPDLPLAIPGWLASVVWLMIFPTWGMARWIAWQNGEAGKVAARWVVTLMAAAIALPLLVPHLDTFGVSVANMALLLLGVATVARLQAVSKIAALWMVPSVAWLGIGAIAGFTAIAQGWSPPFAVTNQAGPAA